MSEPVTDQPSERAGRYSRSFAGLIGAMLVSLIVIGAFVAFRALNRDDLEVEPEAVDYLGAVSALQDSGVSVAYPPTLPEGWFATSVDYQPGAQPAWGVGLLTDDGKFVGLRQEEIAVDDLVSTYVDDNATDAGTVRIQSQVADTWRVFEDEGGDTGYAAEVGEGWVLVYGSAPRSDIETIVEGLTTDPVAG